MADSTIISLPALVTQSGTDLKEVSTNGTGSYKETRTQELNYINANAQISEAQVTNLISDLASKLNLSGGTMTGFLTLNADPTTNLEAATKHYVDNSFSAVDLNTAYANTVGQNFNITSNLNMLGGNLNIGTSTTTAPLTVIGAGGTTFASSVVAYFSSSISSVAGNIYQIAVNKSSVDSLIIGVNKNSNTGQVLSNSTFISTYTSTSTLSIGRGDNTGLPSTTDIGIDGSGNVSIMNGSLNVGTSSPKSSSLLQMLSTSQGFLPPNWTSSQESTNIAALGSSDSGLFWYNSTNNVPTYWDGLDKQVILAIDNIIQGSNMTITNNGNGTVTFSSTGSGSTTTQVQGSFTVYQNNTYTTPSTSSFMAIAIDASKFTPINQVGTSVTTATINGVVTPTIQNTSAGGTRYFKVTFDLSINTSFTAGQTYTFGIAIQRNGGPLVQTNFQVTVAIPAISSAGSFRPVSISGLVDLNTNDYTYLTVISNTASEPVVAYNFNAELIDTTVASLPSTNSLVQGSSNLYLSQNGGTTYQYMSGSATVGNLPKFNSTGGQLIDSGVPAASLFTWQVVTGTIQQMAINTGYIVKSTSPVTFTLPATASSIGSMEIVGTGSATWQINLNTGQFIEYNGLTTTTSTGSVSSGTSNDSARIIYAGDGSGEFNIELSNGMALTLS
jgi:hypothetical protein